MPDFVRPVMSTDEGRVILPVFPLELERDVFLLTARTSHRSVSTRLMLVASRVRNWIEPFVYKTVILRGTEHAAQFLEALSSRPADFAKTHIKALCIHPSIPLTLTVELLTLCSGLESLALWIIPQADAADLVSVLPSLPLSYLSVNLKSILPPNHTKSVLENRPVFVNLTHLDIVNHWAIWTPSLGIEGLPTLTHVAFRFWPRPGNTHSALPTILAQSPRLRVLVLLATLVVIPSAQTYLKEQDIRDVRVVVLKHTQNVADWELMERDSANMWARADWIVEWRRRHQAGPFDYPPWFAYGSVTRQA